MTLERHLTRRSFLGIAGTFAFGVLGASAGLAGGGDVGRPNDLKELASQNNRFAWELYQQVRSEPGNLFLSPNSISTALAMTATGARGRTAEEMTKALHLDSDPGKYAPQFQQLQARLLDQAKGYELRIANATWGQNAYPFLPEFIANVQKHFRAEARSLDFAGDSEGSRVTINRWVEEMTKDKIRDLIPSGMITGSTKLVLTNAIYFKGKWDTQFQKTATRPADFFPTSGEAFKVDTMHRTGHMAYAETDAVQLLELPYEKHQLTMVILLPKKKDGLAELEKSMTADQFDGLLRKRKSATVNVALPRSKTTASFKLGQTLQLMGMRSAFSDDADFSGMTGKPMLKIAEVVHKAFCEINEEGTEAAAATGVVMKELAAPRVDPPIEFKADHPYLYLIRDAQTGSLLFLGRMTDPR
jgi:serpin B